MVVSGNNVAHLFNVLSVPFAFHTSFSYFSFMLPRNILAMIITRSPHTRRHMKATVPVSSAAKLYLPNIILYVGMLRCAPSLIVARSLALTFRVLGFLWTTAVAFSLHRLLTSQDRMP